MTPAVFLAAQILITALGVAAGGGLLVWRVRRRLPVTAAVAVRAGIWVFAAMGAASIVAAGVGLHAFGIMRMLFLAGVVAAPVVCAMILVFGAMRRGALSRAAAALALCGVLGAPLGAWITWAEPFDLRVETADVVLPAARAGTQPLRIGVLSDLQCESVGAHERRAVAELLAQRPDVVLVPGDLFQGTPQEWELWRAPLMELLATVRAPGGVFFVPGDVDDAAMIRALRGNTGWTILLNDIADLRVRGRRVRILGLMNRASSEVARDFEGLRGEDDVRIVLSHAPDTILALTGRPRVDLIVAGHTHGGQIVIPGFGPPVTLSHVPRAIAAGGLHAYAGRAIYVSRGVGVERRQAPRVRLFCPPEVSLLTLRSDSVQRP